MPPKSSKAVPSDARKAAPSGAAKGFGFLPDRAAHHFMVTLPAGKASQDVLLSEHFTYDEAPGRRALSLALGKDDDKIRAILPLRKWEMIADPVRVEFNTRLRATGIKPGKWLRSQTPVSRLLGKELVLLAWAIEDADPAVIPVAVRNWQGLAPEERWWLFTMTNAATGHALSGRNRGWRKAVRFALTENAVAPGELAAARDDYFSLLREEGSSTSAHRPETVSGQSATTV
ncbi:DUF3780 domain-containing protein [soil metagenome]